MDLQVLTRLVERLRLLGVSFYKDSEVEVHLTPQAPAYSAVAEPATTVEELPDVYKRLNPNYSNPALWGKK